jgi:AcrR family transcriptional regulator
MSNDDRTTREAILEAVVTCIERDGIDHLTTRAIAREAGTNIASINYHFRTKDQLVAEVLSMTIDHALEDVYADIEADDISFRRVLENVLFYLIDGGLRFPEITTAHLYRAVIDKDYDSAGAIAIRKAYERLAKRAITELPSEDPARIRFLLSHLLGSVMFTLLAPDFFKLKKPYRPSDLARRRSLAREYTVMFYNGLGRAVAPEGAAEAMRRVAIETIAAVGDLGAVV